MEDLEDIYPAASAACKADEARLAEARRATAELQAGRPGYRALWQHFYTVSEVGLDRELARSEFISICGRARPASIRWSAP